MMGTCCCVRCRHHPYHNKGSQINRDAIVACVEPPCECLQELSEAQPQTITVDVRHGGSVVRVRIAGKAIPLSTGGYARCQKFD